MSCNTKSRLSLWQIITGSIPNLSWKSGSWPQTIGRESPFLSSMATQNSQRLCSHSNSYNRRFKSWLLNCCKLMNPHSQRRPPGAARKPHYHINLSEQSSRKKKAPSAAQKLVLHTRRHCFNPCLATSFHFHWSLNAPYKRKRGIFLTFNVHGGNEGHSGYRDHGHTKTCTK